MSNITIPDFTAYEFTSTRDPYEWLYEHRQDKFILNQLVQAMKKKAGAVGVRSFMSLWNAFLEAEASKEGVALDNATSFEGQPLELMSGKYVCNDTGVHTLDRFGYDIVVCHHPIMPIQRLVNADTGEERLKIAFRKGKIWRNVIVEKTTIASSSSILQLAGVGILVNSDNAKLLSTYLLEIEELNYDIIPEQQSIGRLGWISDNKFAPYVDDLVFDGEANFSHIFNAVSQKGNQQLWVDKMIEMRSSRAPGRYSLAASFASVLLEPCGLLPFFFHLWGASEIGKTVSLMIAASVWASPALGEYVSTFNSTGVGQEMVAGFLNSLPMCLDELQIQSSAGVKDFDKIIYQLTEGVGRTRGAKSGGLQKILTWKNCIITTGEQPISNANSGGGAVNRVIDFECTEKVHPDLVGVCSVIKNNYGWAGKTFVEYLQEPGSTERVSELQRSYYRELLNSDSTDKQAASASAILAADHIATELIFKDGNALTVSDLTAIMAKKQAVDVNARALEYVYELVTSNPNRFKPNDLGQYQGEVWGRDDDTCVYIIKTIFDRLMRDAGFNSSSFLSWAKRQNVIFYDGDRRTKRARVVGTSTNCVCVRKDIDDLMNEEVDFDPV